MHTFRTKIFLELTVVAFIILFSKIIYLQYFTDDKKKAFYNKIRTIKIEPSRGYIYDRDGILLVDNKHSYNLYVVPEQIFSKYGSIDFLANLLNISTDSLRDEIETKSRSASMELRLKRDIGIELFSKIQEHKFQLYGVYARNEWKRNYLKKIAPHIIGYLREVKSFEEETGNIRIGDLKGKEGVEYFYDDVLRGKPGYKKMIRDVKNRKIDDYQKGNWIQAEKGKGITLTINYELQYYCEELLKNKVGTAIVIDCNNGEILAMASKPDYPPEIFSRNLPQKEWKALLSDPKKPLYNKAVLGEYPPGSVIKMASALIAEDQKIITKRTKVFCDGGLKIGKRRFKCWNHKGHGNVNVIQAIMMSCDTYFYNIAKKVDIDKWSEFMKKLGFGKKTGIDLPHERRGNVPNLEYYKKRIKGNLIGRFANLMIGQGELNVTPLQIAQYTAILANGGKLFTPHLLKNYISHGDTVFYQDKKNENLNLDKNALKFVRKGMYHAVNTDGGTAVRARSDKIVIAGKTGTAQNAHGKDHGWFTSYGPFKNPQIAVVIFEEHGGHGSSLTPLAKKIYEKWLEVRSK